MTVYKRLFILFCAALVNLCGEFRTEQVLDGEFIEDDSRAVTLVLPEDGAAVDSRTVFLWTRRSGASYKLKLATDPDFQDVRISRMLRTEAADWTNIKPDDIPPGRYYWRVTTKHFGITTPSETRVLYVRESGRLYVDGNSSEEDEAGTVSAPYKTINTAVLAAARLRALEPDVHVDILVAGGVLTGELITIRKGMSLLGGYNPETWQRDPANYTTTLSGVPLKVNSDATAETLIDGLRIEINNLGPAFILEGNPVVRHNRIVAQNGILITSGKPLVHNNDIYVEGAEAVSTIAGIQCSGESESTIEYNRISAVNSEGVNVFGIHITAGEAIVRHNVIKAILTLAPQSFGDAIDVRSGGDTEIRNNTAAGTGAGLGISAPVSVVDGNIFFVLDSGATADYPVVEYNTGADMEAFTNNFLFDAPEALYYDENSTSINSAGALAGLSGTATVSGNLAPFGAGVHGNATAVFAGGFDYDDLSTWQIKAAGPADLDGGGYNEGDPGADAAAAGPDW